ncbi:MAG TPA: hypothetical protein VMF30_05375 [Pirellulales bacterium]|nr:hypothetical protein [Pirellulales bacterium]
MGKQWKDGYSASVDLYLMIGDQHFGVGEVGPDALVLDRNDTAIPPGAQGDLVIVIDGEKTSQTIILPHGAPIGADEVAYF